MTAPWRVFIVEDDLPTRLHLRRSVGSSTRFSIVGDAGSAAEARERMKHCGQIHVLLTDLLLPDGHGVELIRHTRKHAPECMILVVSIFGDETSVTQCIQAGASGYLLKDGSPIELQGALIELMEGGAPLSPRVARYVLELARNPRLRLPDERAAQDSTATTSAETASNPKLSPREVDVLELLAKGFSPRETAEVLGISVHTVITHSRAIHRKLEVSSRAAAIFEALSLGLITL